MSIDQLAIVFRRKMSSFCEMKLAPLTDSKQSRALSEYMVGLIDDRMPPPVLGRHVNWEEISLACGLEQVSAELRRVGQYGFDAILRWLAETGPSHRKPSVPGKTTKSRSRAKSFSSKRTPTTAKTSHHLKPGPKPKPIEEFPEPLFVRGEVSRNRDTGGAGLGLAIAKNLAQAHGGDVSIGTAKSGGARIEVRIPIYEY